MKLFKGKQQESMGVFFPYGQGTQEKLCDTDDSGPSKKYLLTQYFLSATLVEHDPVMKSLFCWHENLSQPTYQNAF